MGIEFDNLTFDLPKNAENLIKVIGVGGGGGNAVNYMYKQNIKGVDYIICNTDRQALDKSPIVNKIHLGIELTEGLGAGSNPEVGEQSAMESIEEIKAMLGTNTKMAFITAGMGGGTGTGAAPIIAKICRDMGILTVGIVTSPFKFEGEIRLAQAQKGIENLRKQLDSLIVINNNKLRDTYGNLGIKTGFAKADEVLTIAAKGIAEVITKDFEVNIDLRDAHTVLSNSGTAIMGTGYGTGDNRAMDAVKSALESPLLNDNRITGAKNVLLLILYGKEEITMDEVAEINEYIQKEAGNSQELAAGYKTNIIMGMGEEEALEDKVMVTVVATGFSTEQQHEIIDVEPKKIVHSLDENTPFVQELDTTSSFTDISFENSLKRKQQAQSESVPSFTTPQATVSQPIRSEVGITLHAPEKKTNSITIDDSLYRVPVQYEVVERFVAAPQEEFVIYQEKKTTPKPQPVQPLQVEREVIVMEPQRPQASVTKQKAVMSAMAEEDAKIVHNLNDYLEVEEMLIHAHSPQPEEKIDEEFRAEIRVKETTSPKEQPKEENQNAYLAALKENAANRRTTFKNMSHQFSNQNNYRLEDLENTPAYMRKNVDISSSSQASAVSRSTISLDSNNVTQIRENNSFLHDNVD
ncbi:cell division protein FtsZ [Capnocytophaga gingivalis]|jgi:cell division protein ftsZ|uniref:cell division protein FtsZ n=1 Tax=Capnocytophaga gingivalis TaxID=1017 RepID=UPI002B469425|nr:cell division protein FtsZ [Capnocytophaga gingivalis]MEB3015251.1 cell division protein FtsZ [Capnocytophaga gingivalis]